MKPMHQAEDFINTLIAHLPPGVGLEMAALWKPGTPNDYTQPLSYLVSARRANARGANILIRPGQTTSHPWLLLDDLPLQRLRDLVTSIAGLAVQTSQDQGQAWLLADRALTQAERGAVQRSLAQRLNADPGATGGGQFGRLPGFKNQKPGRGNWTNLLVDSTSKVNPLPCARLLAPPGQPAQPMAAMPACSQSQTASSGASSGDGSAREFAFACHRLRAGWPTQRVEQAVAEHALARGKRCSEAAAMAYARATVSAAGRVV